MTIHYLNGDATDPVCNGSKVIVHICNDVGKQGKGFVIAISNRWKEPEQTYKNAFQSEEKPQLGDVQFVPVTDTLTVANVIGQHGVRSPRNKTAAPPIRYDAVREGLSKVAQHAKTHNSSVHMPRIGCGLAGGKWEDIEPIIDLFLIKNGISVYVYDF